MIVNTNAMVSISEANKNFSRIARMVDEKGLTQKIAEFIQKQSL